MTEQNFVRKVTLTDAQREKVDSLEPSLEHLLHEAEIDPSTIWALRHCQITDRETFAALEDTVDGLKTLALDMGIDLAEGGMPHKREFARITTAWKKARAQADIKVTTEALQRQHGEPVAMLPEDWTSVVVQFKKKFGTDLQDADLPSQAYYKEFQERLGTAPENTEELRSKFEVMSNMWLLAQLRQPGRSLFSDLQPTTFQRFLKELLGKVPHSSMLEYCLSYEYELRREAYKQCRGSTIGVNEAWWDAYRSQQHRMMHWLQLVSLSNSSS